MPSDQQKWMISIISALLFYIIALPQTYECLTNPIVESLTGIELEKKGKPTTFGVMIHAIVFLLIVRYMMESSSPSFSSSDSSRFTSYLMSDTE